MKKRRAVSEIVATVIIILITTVLGVALYNLTLSQSNSQSTALVSATKDQEDLSKERINILSVTVSKTANNQMNITIMNYGKIDASITDSYINNERFVVSNGFIQTSQIKSIFIDLQDNIVKGKEYSIILVSSRGGSIAYNWKG